MFVSNNALLDTSAMLSEVRSEKERALLEIEKKEKRYSEKNLAWDKIKKAFEMLNKEIAVLRNDLPHSGGYAKKASVDTEGISSLPPYSVNVTNSASVNIYKIVVNQLAKAHKLRTTDFFESIDTPLGNSKAASRRLIIQQNSDIEIELDLNEKQTSLSQISSLINQKNTSVVASVLRGKEGYYLTLSSTQTGEKNHISVRVDNDEKLNALFYVPKEYIPINKNELAGMVCITSPCDAEFSIDGILCSSATNTVSDALPGVTLNLNAVSQQAYSLKVTEDDKTHIVKDKLKNLVTQYNELFSTIRQFNTNYVSLSNSNRQDFRAITHSMSILNNMDLKKLCYSMPTVINSLTFTDAGKVYTLGDMGITRNFKDGSLSLNEEKFDEMYTKKTMIIESLLFGSNENIGLLDKIQSTMNCFFRDDGKGIIDLNYKQNNLIIKQEKTKRQEKKARIEIELNLFKKKLNDMNEQCMQAMRMQSVLSRLQNY